MSPLGYPMRASIERDASPRHTSPSSPPFSALLLIGILLRPLPPRSLQPIVSAAMATMVRRHPDLFRRLRSLGNAVICIDPVDLPFVFQLRPGTSAPALAVHGRNENLPGAAARISGPIAALLSLIEGAEDGDALFFSRALSVEGDVEIVLALRNAIDGAKIDLLSDLTSAFGSAAQAVRRAIRLPMQAAAAFARDVTLLQSSLIAPIASRIQQQDAVLQRLHDQLDAAATEMRRMRPSSKT